MKRNYCLVFVSLFALTGCASKISVADAKTRANEIRQHEITDEEVKELRIATTSVMETKAKTSYLTLDMKSSQEMIYEVSAEKSFIHTYDKSESSMSEANGEEEFWCYVKDSVLYTVTRVVSGENETKEYSKIEAAEVAANEFKNSLEDMVANLKDGIKLASNQSLEMVDTLGENGETEFEIYTGVKAKGTLTPYSSGEGSLILKGSLSIDNFQGIEGKAKSNVLLSWDKSFIKEATVKFDWSGKKDDETASLSVLSSQKVEGKAKVSYPDLSKYTAK